MAQKRKIQFVAVGPDRATFLHRGRLMTILAEADDDGVRATRLGRPKGARGFMFINPAPVELAEFRDAIASGKLSPELMEIGQRVGAIFEKAWTRPAAASDLQVRLL
ncbi:hypothetical protein [Bosea minatitlanensis]|uniref:Uncharacterized protein n=1 Tax=Bosea minatitlanensis TaxID=128782 RepID=A0ABW0F0I2_9HYPH|nr:hypothetical protein [Bosea minatitlanensis]MCT4493947.1 hypothetical protein [Bosea minatitlanensis]